MWQLLKVLPRLTLDLYELFIQQQANISIDTERREGLSVIVEPLVTLLIKLVLVRFWGR